MAYEDTGDCIKAYCVPDSYSAQSSLNIFANGQLIHSLEPNDFNEYMDGRHQTGKVGFIIDSTIVNNISLMNDLELRDAATDILVYRRASSYPTVQKSVFRLETQLMPLWRTDMGLKDAFRFWYHRIELFSSETVRQILSFHCFGSLYSAGRILYQNYAYYLKDNQSIIMLMQDPYCELAERLLVFNRLSTKGSKDFLSERDALVFAPVLTLAASLSTFDEKDLRRALTRADRQTISVLSDPVTRQLTSATPDEMPTRNSVSRALDELADFAVVGIRAEGHVFRAALAELMEIDPSKIAPAGPITDEVLRIANLLRSISWTEAFLQHDLEIYHHVKSAFDAVHQGKLPKLS